MFILFPFHRLFHRWWSSSSLKYVYQRNNRGGDSPSDNLENDVTQNAPDNTDLWTDSGNYVTSWAGGSGTSSNPYQIATAGQLAYLSYLINGSSSSSYRSLYYKQTANIDLSAHYWDAIGYSSSYYFAGHYDGGGFTISGLFTQSGSSSTYSYQGLFGYVYGQSSSNNAVIENVIIGEDSVIQGYRYVGGIVGYGRYLLLHNCANYGDVLGISRLIGGIIGYATSTFSANNCSFTGQLTGTTSIGGFAGYVSCSGSNVEISDVAIDMDFQGVESESSNYDGIGGVVGWISGSLTEIHDIVAIANIECVSGDSESVVIGVGGIVGIFYSGTLNLYNCSFDGVIDCSTTEYSYVGGILGVTRGGTGADGNELTIDSCFNQGEIIGNNSTGGIAGDVSYCTISNCYNAGNIIGGSSHTGGIAGEYSSSASDEVSRGVINCYNLGNITSNSNYSTSGIVGYISFYRTASIPFIANCWNFGDASYAVLVSATGFGSGSSDVYIRYCYYGGDSSTVVTRDYFNTTVSYCSSVIDENPKTLSWYITTSNWYSSYPWDFENTWGFVNGMNDGYPVLMSTVKFTITYEPNGGTGSMESQTKTAGKDLVLSLNAFTRTGYTFQGWATSPTGGIAYANGATYTDDADITLYAVWKINTYTVTYNGNGATGGSMASSTKTYGVALTLRTNTFTRTAFSFQGWATSPSGGVVYGDGASYTTNANITLYAVWKANNPAHYDSTGDYWYVENGYMPQSRVTNTTTSTYLSTNWNSLSNGSVYYMDGIGDMQSKVYNGNEYCEYNGKYYLVEPIRWRLTYSSSQTTGYGTTTDTLAVMDTIVYVGRYSESAINEGDGYSTTAVGYLDNNQIDEHYLVSWTESMPTYGTTSLYGTSEDFTSYIFVSSIEEIESVAGDYTIKFSDLASDYLTDTGADLFYYTRNLGTNINNIVCLSIDGDVTQKKPNLNFLGVQFTITVSEYGCV